MRYIQNPLFLILLGAFVLRLAMTYYNLTTPSVFIQQDRYADYAQALMDKTINTKQFNQFDAQLFPGYPVMIYLLMFVFDSPITSGIIISILASLGVIYLMHILFNNYVITALIAFFPPWWIKQAGKVATEPIFVFIALLATLSFLKKKVFLAGVLIGLTCTIRPIGISLFAAIALLILIQKNYRSLLYLCGGMFLAICGLLLFNDIVFGHTAILKQFVNASRYNGLRLGLFQLMQDFYRTIEWKQYKIFISGLFYVSSNVIALIALYYHRKKDAKHMLFFLWFVFSLCFILLPSPFTLLDDFGRYALAVVPAYTLGIHYLLTHIYSLLLSKRKGTSPKIKFESRNTKSETNTKY